MQLIFENEALQLISFAITYKCLLIIICFTILKYPLFLVTIFTSRISETYQEWPKQLEVERHSSFTPQVISLSFLKKSMFEAQRSSTFRPQRVFVVKRWMETGSRQFLQLSASTIHCDRDLASHQRAEWWPQSFRKMSSVGTRISFQI